MRHLAETTFRTVSFVWKTPDRDCGAWRNEASSTAWSEKALFDPSDVARHSFGRGRTSHARSMPRGNEFRTNVHVVCFGYRGQAKLVVRRWTRGRCSRRVHYRPKDTVFAGIPCLWPIMSPPSARRADARCCDAGQPARDATRGGVADCAQGGFVRSRIDVAGERKGAFAQSPGRPFGRPRRCPRLRGYADRVSLTGRSPRRR